MIENVDNQEKHGYGLEVILKDTDDVVSMLIKGYEVIVRHNDVGISIDVYHHTCHEVTNISEKQYWFEDLQGSWEI